MSFRHIYRKPLGVSSKTNSRNTTPGRRKEKELKPTPPLVPKLSSEKENKEASFMINLEDILVIERNLSYILENFHNTQEVAKTCEDLWDLTADNTLNHISSLYRDEKKRLVIGYSIVLQSVGIATVHYFCSHFKLNSEASATLRSTLLYVHQGFLVLGKFILLRVPSDDDNVWISKLSKVLEQKPSRNKKTTDMLKLLNHYNSAVSSCLKKICRVFMFRCEDPVIHQLKSAIIQILRNTEIQPVQARKAIEQAFGINRESITLSSVPIPVPFLPPASSSRYTLVLDLDETLVHYMETEEQGQYLTRPYLENFLIEVKKYFELVVFTAAVQDYADWILDDFDHGNLIDFRLYRQHTVPGGNFFLKDLTNLGRDLDKMIIIDNVAENFQLQPGNGILIKSWYDDAEDTALKELIPILVQIAKSSMDVRVALGIFRQQMLEQMSLGVSSPSLCLNNKEVY